ncbi:MAG: regulatory protein RecX [Chitinophagales bacterium]
MDLQQAYLKIQHFCAYQERCEHEVREKLGKLTIFGNNADEIVMLLIEEDFLNENRFASLFATNKLRLKKWGRNKIRQHLKQKKVHSSLISNALDELDEEEYLQILNYLAIKKIELLLPRQADVWAVKQKTVRFLLQKGFEQNLIWQVINDYFATHESSTD